jgi:hypothetical protein
MDGLGSLLAGGNFAVERERVGIVGRTGPSSADTVAGGCDLSSIYLAWRRQRRTIGSAMMGWGKGIRIGR